MQMRGRGGAQHQQPSIRLALNAAAPTSSSAAQPPLLSFLLVYLLSLRPPVLQAPFQAQQQNQVPAAQNGTGRSCGNRRRRNNNCALVYDFKRCYRSKG